MRLKAKELFPMQISENYKIRLIHPDDNVSLFVH